MQIIKKVNGEKYNLMSVTFDFTNGKKQSKVLIENSDNGDKVITNFKDITDRYINSSGTDINPIELLFS